ncbi:hypothetical protein E4U42_000557 [Claviceps africana]|uniref:C2H2 type master regulator of conidiophore development brlA n=1 Tax=Claviceps africana TaxID=83212 RepID=A0A8K0NKG7_9HYPO|nr:hypothetical protein E4U42_000557 [Claviceps africana]
MMHDAHMAFDGDVASSRHSNIDVANVHLDFNTLLSAEHINSTFGSFETCVHDDSCLHFTQPQRPQERGTHDYGQPPPKTASPAFARPQHRARRRGGGGGSRRQSLSPLISMDDSQHYPWDPMFSDNAMTGCAPPCGGGLDACQDDDCMSVLSCSSACEGSCPSECGETSQKVCCDDEACRSPQVCVQEDCAAESQPCTDANCVVNPCTTQPQPQPQTQQALVSPVLSDGDKAAAAALASFGDGQSRVFRDAYMQQQQQQQQPPPQLLPPYADASRQGYMDFMDLPNSLPCGSLSMESILENLNGPSNLPSQPSHMAFEYALASHIMQYHDPVHGLAEHGSCLANDLSQLITKCTLPKYNPDDLANVDPFLPQLQTHQCGFPIQDPNEFAHHIFEEHGPNFMSHAPHQHGGFSAPSHSAAHSHHDGVRDDPWFNFNAAPGSKHSTPSTSPLTTLSMGASLSETPVSLPMLSPLQSEASLQDVAATATATITTTNTTMARTLGPTSERKSPDVVQDDLYICRWVVGHDSSSSSSICGQRFDSDEQLQKHCKHQHLKQLQKLHGGFRCGWADCSRDTCFTQRSKVERHMQVHTGYKPVQCSVCGAALSAKQALDQHMRIHTGETPWVCKVPGCGCAFKQQSALTMHERTHTGDKPLECEICGKRFSESSNLSKHRRTHNVKGMHECQLCGKDFHRLDQLRRHMGTNHKDRPAEVDAFLSQAKSKIKAHKMSRLKEAKARARDVGMIKREPFSKMADDVDDDGVDLCLDSTTGIS